MGIKRDREPQGAPDYKIDVNFTSTAAIITQRLVKLSSGGGVKPTTGSSGRAALGVALNATTGSGKVVAVRRFGLATVEASSRAIKKGDWVRATSGAASTASRLGGTVRTSTSAVPNVVGQAMTSCAAGAGKRTVTIFVVPTINSGLLL